MKANKVLERLGVTRRTLSNYVKQNKIKVTKLENGFYEYDDLDVSNIEKNRSYSDKVVVYLNNSRHDFNLGKIKVKEVLEYLISLDQYNINDDKRDNRDRETIQSAS